MGRKRERVIERRNSNHEGKEKNGKEGEKKREGRERWENVG